MPLLAGDMMATLANACMFTKIAYQDTTGTRKEESASATQRLAQITITGTEPDVLANANQRNVLLVLTGRNHGANVETYHYLAVRMSIMMIGDTSASAYQM